MQAAQRKEIHSTRQVSPLKRADCNSPSAHRQSRLLAQSAHPPPSTSGPTSQAGHSGVSSATATGRLHGVLAGSVGLSSESFKSPLIGNAMEVDHGAASPQHDTPSNSASAEGGLTSSTQHAIDADTSNEILFASSLSNQELLPGYSYCCPACLGCSASYGKASTGSATTCM